METSLQYRCIVCQQGLSRLFLLGGQRRRDQLTTSDFDEVTCKRCRPEATKANTKRPQAPDAAQTDIVAYEARLAVAAKREAKLVALEASHAAHKASGASNAELRVIADQIIALVRQGR